jgi:ribosomal-protein-alanine N-acetyltransferase
MIKTKRLELVRIDNKFSNDLFEVWNDYDVIKYTYLTLIQTQNECNERIEMLMNRTDVNFNNNFVVLLEDKAIGIAGFPIRKQDEFNCGFYYHYGKKYWGNGYATEVANALLEYIFSKYPNATVNADAVSINPVSIEVLKKIGFHQTHIEEKGFNNNGMQLDLVHFISKN